MARNYFEEAGEVFERMSNEPPPQLDRFIDTILDSWERGGKLLSFGNGGSAADSIHFTTELVHKVLEEPIQQPAISLSSNTSSLTAIPNDWGFEEVFSCQVESLARPVDVLLGITTSGTSSNVVAGLQAGLEIGATCFGLTGASTGRLGEIDGIHVISVPAESTAHAQEGHIACLHYVCFQVERMLQASHDREEVTRDP